MDTTTLKGFAGHLLTAMDNKPSIADRIDAGEDPTAVLARYQIPATMSTPVLHCIGFFQSDMHEWAEAIQELM